MNEYDQQKVSELKAILSDISTDDYTDFDYLRWLQGYDYNLDVIVPTLRNHFLFLRCFDFENFDRKSEVMEKYWPYGLIKLTGKGHSFPYIESHGKWDPDGIMKSISKVDIRLHRMYKSEQVLKVMRNHEKETGHQAFTTFIIDAEGTQITAKRMISLTSGPYKNLINFMLKHYVEMTDKVIIINAPTIAWALFNIVKPILPEKTRNKFVILGSNWKSDILQHIDPEILPVHYGGTLVDENNDPKCQSLIVYPTKVPESLYWSPSDDDPKPDDLKVLTVSPGRTAFVTIVITKENSFLEWYYVTDHNWGFGIFFTKDENESKIENMEMAFPQLDHFIGPPLVPEKGKIKCNKVGYYKVWFNNYFSWFTNLNVSYRISVTLSS